MRLEGQGYKMLNSNNPEATRKNKRNRGWVKDHGASAKKRKTCK